MSTELTHPSANPSGTAQPEKTTYTVQAKKDYERIAREFRLSLDYEARLNAGRDEQILVRHVQDAADSLVATGIGKTIDVVIVWLLPLSTCFLGIGGSGFIKILNGEDVDPGTVIFMSVGFICLGAAAALYFKGGSLKRWFQRRARKKALNSPSNS